MLNIYIELNFDVLQAATCGRYVDNNDTRLVVLGPIAFLENYNLTTSSGKHLEGINHAHIVSLMYKLITSRRGSDDLSIGFDRSRDIRNYELTNNKNFKGKYHVRIYVKDVFGFAEQQKTGICGLGYKLTLTRNIDNAALNEDNTTNNDKIKINAIDCYVPHYICCLEEYNKLMNQIVKKTPAELHYPEGSVLMEEVKIQLFWTFELGSQEGINVPLWIYVVFNQKTVDNTIKI